MELKTIDRIEQLIEHYELSNKAFDSKVGQVTGYVSKAIKKHTNVGSQVLENIIFAFPEVSLEWLLSGQGSMLKKNYDQVSEGESEYQTPESHFEKGLIALLRKPNVKDVLKDIVFEKTQKKHRD